MRDNKDQQNNNMSMEEQALQNSNDPQAKENVPAQKDGFRYDYNDNADL
ncbi:hypothetical protein [Bacillus dakarensis]|nr:hypothetical protein [Bacillus dakarensis]